MHDPSHFELHDLQACQQLAQNTGKNMGAANNSSLAELLLSFLVMYAAACDEWLCAALLLIAQDLLVTQLGCHAV